MGLPAQVVPGRSAVGGGSLPGETLPTRLVALDAQVPGVESADVVAARLRAGDPPVIARIEDDHLVFDLRTVLPEQEATLWRMVAKAVQ